MPEEKKEAVKKTEEAKKEVKVETGAKEPKKGAKSEETSEKSSKKSKKSKRRSIPLGNAYIKATYNNTLVTITEPNGDVLVWTSSGSSGFKGTRKATPYAAQVAAENASEKAKVYGLEKVHVFIKGVGAGREQAVRGLHSSGLDILSISDTTPIPHNGCRKKKSRRI
jgi:small subunit ribosomal protein S11